MSAQTATAPGPAPAGAARPTASADVSVPASVDGLLDLSADELHTLYVNARVPRIGDVSGDLVGRMLAIDLVPPRVNAAARAWARRPSFPWRGKSFTPQGEDRGEGINRVLSDRWKLFRFETSIAPSRAGDFDALQLDYDLPENPFFIRAIEDEIRELRPGLWLGQAWLRTGDKRTLVLYFGLERRA